MVFVAMNVVGDSKREGIVDSRLGSIEENLNQKIEVGFVKQNIKKVSSEVGIER